MAAHEERVTVGWISPMALELTPAIALLEQRTKKFVDRDDTCYHVGKIGHHYVVAAVCPRIGTHPAAYLISNMRHSFPNIKHFFVVGIAGGKPSYGTSLKEQIVLGDVVVGYPQWNEGGVAHHESGAWGDGDRFTHSGHLLHPSYALLTAVNNLRANHDLKPGTNIPKFLNELREQIIEQEQSEFDDPGEEYDNLFLDNYSHLDRERSCQDICDLNLSKRRHDRGGAAMRRTDSPRVHYGTVASGNSLIVSSEKRDSLYKNHQAICFEMESAGVMDNHQALAIRGICDYADSHKNKKWQKYAAATAAAYAKELLLILPPGNTGKPRNI